MPKRIGQLLVTTEKERRRLVQAGYLLSKFQDFQNMQKLERGTGAVFLKIFA